MIELIRQTQRWVQPGAMKVETELQAGDLTIARLRSPSWLKNPPTPPFQILELSFPRGRSESRC
jgi:hypothetical protein